MLKDQPVYTTSRVTSNCPTPEGIQDNHLIQCHHFQMICQYLHVPIIILDNQFTVVMANENCLAALNFKQLEDIVGTTFSLNSKKMPPSGICQNIIAGGVTKPLPEVRFDARLMATEEGDFFVVTLTDPSREKQQRSMEQIFFHDILNTAGGMHGIAEMLLEAEPEEVPDLQDSVHNLAAQLVDEITAQRDFVAAENGELSVKNQPIQSHSLLQSLARTYGNHPSSGQRHIIIKEKRGSLQFIGDPVLLNRILGNMIKNALEASGYPEAVTLQSDLLPTETHKPEHVVFSVHNSGFIPEKNQDQIFQHSFSTKGVGRGLGTFSMRLLAEQYLGGQVSFSTDPTTGTTFSITLPLGGP